MGRRPGRTYLDKVLLPLPTGKKAEIAAAAKAAGVGVAEYIRQAVDARLARRATEATAERNSPERRGARAMKRGTTA